MLICPQQLLHQNRNSSSHNNAKRKSLSHCRICVCPFVTQRFGCSCGKQNGSARWWYHFSSATNIVSKISPLVYRSKSNVAILVLGNNITLRQLHAPHVHLCHVSNKPDSCQIYHPWCLDPVRSRWCFHRWFRGPLPYLTHCLLPYHPSLRIDSVRWRCSMWSRHGSMYQGQDQRQPAEKRREWEISLTRIR